jgi:hypothetical protein
MAYNPNNRYMGPEFALDVMKQREQQAEKEKEDKGLLDGFKKLHAASPELQGMVPVRDWGDVAPNMVRGIMQGIQAMSVETQRRAQAEQIMASQQQRQFQPRVMDLDGDGIPDAMMTAPGRAEQLDVPKRTAFSPEQLGVARPIPGMAGGLFVPTSTGGGQVIEPPESDKPLTRRQIMDQETKLMTTKLEDKGYIGGGMTVAEYLDATWNEDGTQKPGSVAKREYERMIDRLLEIRELAGEDTGALRRRVAVAAPTAEKADDGGFFGRWKKRREKAAPAAGNRPGPGAGGVDADAFFRSLGQ